MKVLATVSLAAFSAAIVIPREGILDQIAVESHKAFDVLSDKASEVGEAAKAFGPALVDTEQAAGHEINHQVEELHKLGLDVKESTERGVLSWIKPKKPHGGHHKHNKTVYELIADSKYTTKLASLINEYEDLVDLLNSTSANFTVFAPTDAAFAKIPDHAPKPSKEALKKILTYHVSEVFYPASRVLANPTIPTLLEGSGLSPKPEKTPQRLSFQLGLRGLTVNFYSRVVAINIFGKNGVIHGVDSILAPPFPASEIINFVPGRFSTLELGLTKTGLFAAINDTSTHSGGTLFAPSNWAFQKLGYKINGFLFSKYGEKYLKALLKYHVVANQTLYTDAFYKNTFDCSSIPKGKFHVDLPTLLKDRFLSIDIAQFGSLVDFRINGFTGLSASNLIAKDGVIQIVSSVLIPPKHVGDSFDDWNADEPTVEALKERLEPFVDADGPSNAAVRDWDL